MASLRKFIVGNWKMNGNKALLVEAIAIATKSSDLTQIDTAICPPATLISLMCDALPDFSIGGQDCHVEPKGAYTGCVSAPMLLDAGASFTIVGHSERREGFAETDDVVHAKADIALATGLDVILCVGEPKSVREDGAAEAFVLDQLDGSLPDLVDGRTLAVAYEPIWAIGTGLTPTAEDVWVMHATIRGKLMDRYGETGANMRILYGGSVTGDNADELLAVENVDGALVGGASLTAEKFVPIMEAAVRVSS